MFCRTTEGLKNSMEEELRTEDEKINEDRLNFFMQEKVKVHIVLIRKNYAGKNIFLRGLLDRKVAEKVWVIKEMKLGEVRVFLSEIAPHGVLELREDKRRW